jgi:hypothetical protein
MDGLLVYLFSIYQQPIHDELVVDIVPEQVKA